MSIWTEENLNYVKNCASLYTDEEIAYSLSQKLGVTVKSRAVTYQRQKMGVAKKRGRLGKKELVNPEVPGRAV